MLDYHPPVDQLLTRGEPHESAEWFEYSKLGLTGADVPDLIRMATDPILNRAETDSAEVWAPLHAWRALGQLRAMAAVEPLLALLDRAAEEHDEYALDELPEVFALLGPAAIPVLEAHLSDASRPRRSRIEAGTALVYLEENHPEVRAQCVGILTRLLEAAAQNDREFNGFLVAHLLDLDAVEAAPVMERAFADGHVAEGIAGDWPAVAYELGLSDAPPQNYSAPSFPTGGGEPPFVRSSPGERLPRPPAAKAKAKAKRQQAAKSRKMNRKRKRKK